MTGGDLKNIALKDVIKKLSLLVMFISTDLSCKFNHKTFNDE